MYHQKGRRVVLLLLILVIGSVVELIVSYTSRNTLRSFQTLRLLVVFGVVYALWREISKDFAQKQKRIQAKERRKQEPLPADWLSFRALLHLVFLLVFTVLHGLIALALVYLLLMQDDHTPLS